jgi:hypothetical protein
MFLRAFTDVGRLRLLEVLTGHELTAAGCGARLGVAVGELAAPLSDLVGRGCVTQRLVNGAARYRISDPRLAEMLSLSRALAVERSDRLGTCGQVGLGEGEQ